MTVYIHLCAAVEDEPIVDALTKHLRPLQTRFDVRVTRAKDILPGSDVSDDRRALLDEADIILLLLSADFLASDQCRRDMTIALERRDAKAANVVTVLARPCMWKEPPLSNLPLLPRDLEPLRDGQGLRETALTEVVEGIRAQLPERALDAECPFPGLDVFDEAKAAFFHGREEEIEEGLAKLRDSTARIRWLQVEGPSGAGKSSFARAGLVPSVRQGKLGGSWFAAVFRPGQNPILNLAEAVHRELSPPGVRFLSEVTTSLAASPFALRDFLRQHMPQKIRMLLVVDQLEEAFTLEASGQSLKDLDGLLANALEDIEGPLWLVTTIRADFIGRMGELPLLERWMNDASRYYLRPMSEEGLRRAITEPARSVGLQLDDGLEDRIITDAAASPGALPLVAHVLQALYAEREGQILTARAYMAMGGVEGALVKSADAIVEGLQEDGRARARNLLLRLVKTGHGSEDTRQSAPRAEAIAAAGGDERAEQILARLSGGRALGSESAPVRLVVVRTEASGEVVDLVHEALIQRWSTLATWITEKRKALELRDDLEGSARSWEAAGAPVEGLPKGRMLERFRDVDRGLLGTSAREFLEKAEQAETQAESEKKRQEAMARRRTRRTIGGLLGIAILLALLAAAAGWQSYRETRARRDADSRRLAVASELAGSRKESQVQLLLAVEAAKAAKAAGGSLPAPVLQALVAAVTSASENEVLLDLSQWFFAPLGWRAVLSEDGQRVAAYDAFNHLMFFGPVVGHTSPIVFKVNFQEGQLSLDARSNRALLRYNDNAVLFDMEGEHRPLPLSAHLGEVRSWTGSRDGAKVAIGLSDGSTGIWNTNQSPVPLALAGHSSPVSAVAFSPNGQVLVTGDREGMLFIWRLAESHDPIVIHAHEDAVSEVVFSPDGTLMVSGSNDKTARVWRVEDTAELMTLDGHEGMVTSAAFSQDGRQIATGSADTVARVWDLSHPREPRLLRGHDSTIWQVRFSADGSRLLTRSSDRTVRLWRLDGNETPLVLRGHNGDLSGAWFANGDSRVVTASEDGTVRSWLLDARPEPLVLRGATSRTREPSFSPDGARVLATSADNTALVWDLDRPNAPLILRGHTGWLHEAAFDSTGQSIVTASEDGTARVWRAGHFDQPVVLSGHLDAVVTARFSSDGKRVVTGSRDSTARVWNADGSGVPIVLSGHDRTVICARFDGNNRVLTYSAMQHWLWEISDSRSISRKESRAWRCDYRDLRDGASIRVGYPDEALNIFFDGPPKERLRLSGYAGHATDGAFSTDGKRVAATSEEGSVLVWTIDPDRLVEMACARAGRNLSEREWGDYFGDTPYHKTCEQWPAALTSPSAKPLPAKPQPIPRARQPSSAPSPP